jgi:ubiquitin C-terminal hydrolase
MKKKQTLTLQDCVLWTFRETQLDKDDSYECDQCHKKSRCVRKTSIWMCPKVLVICLKRFIVRYLPDRRVSLDKNQTDISIPLNMDLSDTKYELYGIANHTGNQRGGHCFATLKKPGGKWVTVDDTSISVANDTAFGGSTPYLLFYRTI